MKFSLKILLFSLLAFAGLRSENSSLVDNKDNLLKFVEQLDRKSIEVYLNEHKSLSSDYKEKMLLILDNKEKNISKMNKNGKIGALLFAGSTGLYFLIEGITFNPKTEFFANLELATKKAHHFGSYEIKAHFNVFKLILYRSLTRYLSNCIAGGAGIGGFVLMGLIYIDSKIDLKEIQKIRELINSTKTA